MKSKKTNGSGNGHDKKEDKIVHFPSLAERRKMMEWKRPAGAVKSVPFFNFGRIPVFTRVVIAIFVAVQIAQMFMPNDMKTTFIYNFGFVPGYYTGVYAPFPLSALISPITHIFIHGGWMHLAFNSVMAVSLGVFFEREFGTRRTVIFFFLCGLAGALFYFLLNPMSTAPVIGASGSVSGMFGALIMLLGKRGGLGHRMRSPWPLIVFWVLFMILAGQVGGTNTAWQAHIGGFLAGIGLLYLMQKGKIRL